MTGDSLTLFRAHMDDVAQRARSGRVSSKVQRYVRAYIAGLPQDITVRWFPSDDLGAIEARIRDLVKRNLEVWISQGLPWNPDVDGQLASIEKRTDLIKGIGSLEDFHQRVVPRLRAWEAGSWAKVFYDTPRRALVSGTIRIDATQAHAVHYQDMRAIRLEAAAGIADIRDLDRQMSARQVVVIHPREGLLPTLDQALSPLGYTVVSIKQLASAFAQLSQLVLTSRPDSDPKAKPSEPKAVILDCTSSQEEGLDLLNTLKQDAQMASIPVILLIDDERRVPEALRPAAASLLQLPVSAEDIRLGVFLTGFQLIGGPDGLRLPSLGLGIQDRVDGLLRTVFGPNGAYRHMMVEIANAERRPTIAFEFKIVPQDPYDFFFLDYEWSGKKDPVHRFDWAYSFGQGV